MFCMTIDNVLEIYEEVIHSSVIEELQKQIQNVLPPEGTDSFYDLLQSEMQHGDISLQLIDDTLPYVFLYNNFNKVKNQKLPK